MTDRKARGSQGNKRQAKPRPSSKEPVAATHGMQLRKDAGENAERRSGGVRAPETTASGTIKDSAAMGSSEREVEAGGDFAQPAPQANDEEDSP